MKKIYSILAVVATVTLSNAQNNLFKGSDFNNWTDFETSLTQHGLKYAVKSEGTGINGTNALLINSSHETKNDYVFSVPTIEHNGTFIKIKVKGNSGGLSFNVGDKFFNIPSGVSSDTTIKASTSNYYLGSINTTDWITLTLDLTGVTFNKTAFAVKLQKASTPNLLIDDITTDATLSIADFAKEKSVFVKNTFVNNGVLNFANGGDIKIFNQNGQVVKSAKVEVNSTLDISSLSTGVYIVVGVVNGEKVSQKIIKK